MSEKFDRGCPPPPGVLRPYKFPSFASIKLGNGMRLLAQKEPSFPIVNVQMLLPAGSQNNPLDQPGLADLHGELLDEGTKRRNSSEIALAVEQLGSSMTSGAGWNTAYVELPSLLTQRLDAGLELLAETTLEPNFPIDQFDRLVEEHRVDLLRRRSIPRLIADDTFNRIVYAGTVYGFPSRGVPEVLANFDRKTVVDFHNRHMLPGESCLVVVGDIDIDHVQRRAEELFGRWRSGDAVPEPTIKPTPLPERQVHIVDRPGSAQTQLQFGHVGLPRKHPDFHKVMVANVLLGGKFTSRLNLNLRERHGFTYGVNSLFMRRRGPGPFATRTAVATEVAGDAVRESLFEFERMRQELVTEEELRETQDYILGVFPYTVQTIADLSSRLESLVVYDLPDEHYLSFPAVLGDVTREEVLEVSRAHIRPDSMAIVAVGPVDALRPQLEAFGPITVHST